MSEQPLDDPFLNFVERASRLIQRTIPGFIRWLFAAILSSAIAAWFWSPLWMAIPHPLGEGRWERNDRWGTHISGGEGIVIAGAVAVFALWAWIQVCRTGWSFLRRSKKAQTAKPPRQG